MTDSVRELRRQTVLLHDVTAKAITERETATTKLGKILSKVR